MDGEAPEEHFVALAQFLARVQEQALAEPPRSGQKEMLALVEHPPDVGGLVDVVAVLLANLAEILHTDG